MEGFHGDQLLPLSQGQGQWSDNDAGVTGITTKALLTSSLEASLTDGPCALKIRVDDQTLVGRMWLASQLGSGKRVFR